MNNNRIRQAKVNGLLSIIIVVGLLFVRRDAQRLFDRQFGVPQKVDLAAILHDPAAYQVRYIEFEGPIWGNISVCDEMAGHTLGPKSSLHIGTVALNEMGIIAANADVEPDMALGSAFGVVQGWVRRYDGPIGCEFIGREGRSGPSSVGTLWYIEAARIRLIAR